MRVVGGEDRALGVDRDDPRARAVLLEVAPDAGDRPAGPDRDDDRVDVTAVRLLPDLGPGRLVVGLGVRRVRVLVGLEPSRDLLGEPVGDGVVALGRGRFDGGRGDHDLGAVRAEHRDLLLAHLVRHHEDAAIAAERRGDREPDAGVPRGRLDDRPARAEPPVLLGGLEHREPDPVLHRAAGVQVLELREQLTGTSRLRRSRRTIGVRPTSSRTVGYSRRAIAAEAYFVAFRRRTRPEFDRVKSSVDAVSLS